MQTVKTPRSQHTRTKAKCTVLYLMLLKTVGCSRVVEGEVTHTHSGTAQLLSLHHFCFSEPAGRVSQCWPCGPVILQVNMECITNSIGLCYSQMGQLQQIIGTLNLFNVCFSKWCGERLTLTDGQSETTLLKSSHHSTEFAIHFSADNSQGLNWDQLILYLITYSCYYEFIHNNWGRGGGVDFFRAKHFD